MHLVSPSAHTPSPEAELGNGRGPGGGNKSWGVLALGLPRLPPTPPLAGLPPTASPQGAMNLALPDSEEKGAFLENSYQLIPFAAVCYSHRRPLLRTDMPGSGPVQLVSAQPCEGVLSPSAFNRRGNEGPEPLAGWACAAQRAKGCSWDSNFCLLGSKTFAPAATSPLAAHQQTSLGLGLFCRALASLLNILRLF